MSAPRTTLRFGIFEVRVDTGELVRRGRKLRLQEKSFRVLAALLERPGTLVTREELASRLWPDGVFVDIDHGLNAAVNRLRAALGETAERPRYIETLPRRGYRFIAPVDGAVAAVGESVSSDSVDAFDDVSGVARLRTLLEREPELSSAELRDLPSEVAGVLERLTENTRHRSGSIRRLVSLLKAFPTSDSPSADTGGSHASSPELNLSWFIESLRKEVGEPETYACVGRDGELSRLDERLNEVLTGKGGLVFVTGEAGSGKSTLLDTFARRALERDPGLVVASGAAGEQPYLAFRELLAMLTGDLQSMKSAAVTMSFDNALRLTDTLASVVRSLMKVAPDLVGTFLPGEALWSRAKHSGISSSERRRLHHLVRQQNTMHPTATIQGSLFEQWTRFLIELGRKKPLVLILEDLHRADSGTVSLLFHLSRRVAGYPILILGTYRPVELVTGEEEDRHPLEAAARELRGQLGDVELRLEGSRELTDAIARSQSHHLASDQREELFRLSQGNPLFVLELLNAEGADRITPRIEAVIAERLRRVPARQRRILDLASVDGEEFTAEILASVAKMSDEEVIRILSGQLDKRSALVSVRDVRRYGGQRFSGYRFRHPLYQAYLYAQLDKVERSYLHEELGRALERLARDGSHEWAPKLARHFEAAGLTDVAARYAKR